jgi:hypothetical protein
MNRLVFVSAALLALGTQAAAQVRPQDCRPVFPVPDDVVAMIPPDVVAVQAPPVAVASRRFVGLPILIPLLFGAGLIAIVSHHDHHHNTVSPA